MRLYLLLGFILWLVATILLRLLGQIFFSTPLAVVLTFLVTGVVLVLALLRLFVRTRMDLSRRLRVALSLALPGMFLDILSVTFAALVFPNIPATAQTAFAGCLLWAYSLVLLTALLPLSPALALAREEHADAR